MRRDRAAGALEREILACLAAADTAMTPAEVQAALPGDLAYTTVMTTLARMHAKQALTREPRGRAFAYALVGDVDEARASLTAFQMRRLLDAGDDRAGVLARFVAQLEPEDEHLLQQLLGESGVDPA
jgi:predicted transcriptional regulator